MHTTITHILTGIDPNSFPGNIPQGVNPPFVNYKVSSTDPSRTKSGASEIDFPTLIIDIYDLKLKGALTKAESIRTALDFYSDATITSITFSDQSEDFSFDSEFSMIRQFYRIRLKR